ncbi:9424a8ce-9731-4422-97d3-e5c0e5851ba5 [Thermothielavioides terrestris]|uniref:9424a8ce-9731-4422-97d3-e5c0e5851ba5 n=1 Tax=Thermothielavioides terrestris TaxID=2587410 RepID=A0A3S4D0P9_9PEZI|nr:9424a8ce-9731-4422-97d3-e5c0e5851ba5 [Thermothielavioides terrestris]
MADSSAAQQPPGMENANAGHSAVDTAAAAAPEAHDTPMTDAPAQTAPPASTAHAQPNNNNNAAAPFLSAPPTAPSPSPSHPQPPAAPPARVPTPTTTTTPAATAPGMPPHAGTTAGFAMPAEAAAHGAPVRQYINGRITGVLLEGMKMVAREQ